MRVAALSSPVLAGHAAVRRAGDGACSRAKHRAWQVVSLVDGVGGRSRLPAWRTRRQNESRALPAPGQRQRRPCRRKHRSPSPPPGKPSFVLATLRTPGSLSRSSRDGAGDLPARSSEPQHATHLPRWRLTVVYRHLGTLAVPAGMRLSASIVPPAAYADRRAFLHRTTALGKTTPSAHAASAPAGTARSPMASHRWARSPAIQTASRSGRRAESSGPIARAAGVGGPSSSHRARVTDGRPGGGGGRAQLTGGRPLIRRALAGGCVCARSSEAGRLLLRRGRRAAASRVAWSRGRCRAKAPRGRRAQRWRNGDGGATWPS
jgi:hypothetical protein